MPLSTLMLCSSYAKNEERLKMLSLRTSRRAKWAFKCFFAFCVVAAGAVAVACLGRVAHWDDYLAGGGAVEGHLGQEQEVGGFAVRFEELGGLAVCGVGDAGLGL